MPSVNRTDQHDIETPDTVEFRFGIETLEASIRESTTAISMPVAGLLNPFTGEPTIGPLAILLDDAGGMVNFYRRDPDEWTVSSELALEFSPDGIAIILNDPATPVVAHARPLGPKGTSSLALCTLTHGETMIGGGTVRSFYIPMTSEIGERPEETLVKTPETTLAALMAVRTRTAEGGTQMLSQIPDPILNNDIGIVHGGVAAAGLELVASAAVNDGRAGEPFRTASVRVNFLRPFFAGRESRYVGTALRVGRGTAVGDAQAIGDDGKVAVIARVTAYC
jgi:uncharacterized protein (TIGR00369 family)